MSRLSNYFLPTVKEAPADAEAVSHVLMVRAGLTRQLGAGLWTFLPAGWRSHRRVEQIIREELDAVGCQEMLMPVMHPAELWRQTGRYGLAEQFRLKDRKETDYVLAMTHEEAATYHGGRWPPPRGSWRGRSRSPCGPSAGTARRGRSGRSGARARPGA